MVGANWVDSPAGMIARLDAALARRGEDIVLQRMLTDEAGMQTPTYQAACRASVRGHRPQALDESEVPNTKAVISPTGLTAALWPGLPQKDDRVIFQGDRSANVEQVAPIYVDGILVRIDIEFRE